VAITWRWLQRRSEDSYCGAAPVQEGPRRTANAFHAGGVGPLWGMAQDTVTGFDSLSRDCVTGYEMDALPEFDLK
jgi:hypothetical protein